MDSMALVTAEPLDEQMKEIGQIRPTDRVKELRERVRAAMYREAVMWQCPERVDDAVMAEPVAVRKARAIALKLSAMPTDLWEDQLFAGSLTLEEPRLHAERPFPEYLTEAELVDAKERGLSTGCFGHIVPDYPALLSEGLVAIRENAARENAAARSLDEQAFLESVIIAIDGVLHYAQALADRCRLQAESAGDGRREELLKMAENLDHVPAYPAQTFWQALQSVWLLHMIFHATKNNNAIGRIDQYLWPFLERDLSAGTIDIDRAAELVDCFMLKFNERAQTNEDQMPDRRIDEKTDFSLRTRHGTSSQIGTSRDRIDATNHWLQNIIVGGIDPHGRDGTNPVSFLILRGFRDNRMTNPLVTVRAHRNSPDSLIRYASEVLKEGGGMPAFFNDEALVPALENLGIETQDARDYTNDGCWEVIIPGRTDFKFQRLSLMLCLEWALNRGVTRRTGEFEGADTGDPRLFSSFDDVWDAFTRQVDTMVGQTVKSVVEKRDERNIYAPVPLLSAMIDGTIAARRDLTAGGAKYRTHGMLAESAAHTIDSIIALKKVVYEDRRVSMKTLCDALDADFAGFEDARKLMRDAPKYGNDDLYADDIGRKVIGTFTEIVRRHAAAHEAVVRYPCGVATFSWYIGIGEGLGSSPDGRLSGEPVSSNFSPALGRDMQGLPSAILSYGGMPHHRLPAGGPLDLRVARKTVDGEDGTQRLMGLVKGFIETGGSMLTITVADTEELKAAQRDPDRYESLRVRMGGWCAYFTALSREQQNHHIKRQEGRG